MSDKNNDMNLKTIIEVKASPEIEKVIAELMQRKPEMQSAERGINPASPAGVAVSCNG